MKDYIDFILRKAKKPISYDSILERYVLLKQQNDESYLLTEDDKNEILNILNEELSNYNYYQTRDGLYMLLGKTQYRKGKFYGNRAGEGVVICITSYINRYGEQIVSEDRFPISKECTNGAIDGDSVLIDISVKKPEVAKVLERNLSYVAGVVTRIGAQYYVQPTDKKLQGLTIAIEDDVIEGELVLVSLEAKRDANFYLGKVTQVFRHKDDPHKDVLFEAFKCGMPEGFSEESMKQLETIPNAIRESDKAGRYDFTNMNIVSMDGADTKDKDDCIFYQILPNGNYIMESHIADTPTFVPFGSPLHKDAYRKGNSYYFGGCVEPQYPRKLSNGIYSLHDGVERLCKSAIVEYAKEGHVVSRSLVPSVIKSRMGMTYEKVNNILQEGIVDPDYQDYKDNLAGMYELAKKLRANRIAHGAIIIHKPELKFIHDEYGKPIAPVIRTSGPAEMLIEEFMLASGVNVGEILKEAGIPCVYRCHAPSDVNKVKDFLRLLNVIGFPSPYTAEEVCTNKTIFQMLVNHLDNTGPLQPVLMTNLIKCMSHAYYSTNNIGHYGTGFEVIIHFTSPIRRLADDTNSRIIDDCYFEKDLKKRKEAICKWNVLAPEFANQATKMERVAEKIERNVLLMESAVYMSQFVGQEMEGIVISSGNHGLMIQLDNLIEGRVRLRDLEGDYVYKPESFTLLSRNGKDSYYIGDRLKLRLIYADKDKKTIDFSVIEKIYENPFMANNEINKKAKSKYLDKNRKRA